MSMEDARPFASLKHNAENFITGFKEDIENCNALLTEKITDLIRDPDSLGMSTQLKKGADAYLEFSKTKYIIFLSMKSHFDEMIEKWSAMFQDIEKNFLENVEIFLAETKLEAKLPSSSSNTSKKSRLSFSSGKQEVLQAVSSSICPLISSLTTKVPALVTSPLRMSNGSPSTKINIKYHSDKALVTSPLRASDGTPSTRINIRYHYPQEGSNSIPSTNTDIKSRSEKASQFLPENRVLRAVSSNDDEEIDSDDSSKQEELPKPPARKGGRPSRKDATNTLNKSSEPPKQLLKKGGRAKKGNTNDFNGSADLVETSANVSMRNIRRTTKPASKMELKTSVPEHASEDIVDEFDMGPSTSKSRRKTMFVPQINDQDLSDQEPSPERTSRTKSKRKTMAGLSDFTVAPAPKRLKSSGRKSISVANEDDTKDNLLDGGDSTELGNYSSWVDLKSVSNIPASCGIYELKVWRAKKPAFIGSCENLRQTLTLHKLGQNSGHKHLDKYLERNLKDVSVRYEVVSSIQIAKTEVKSRIANFVQIHKTTPAYN